MSMSMRPMWPMRSMCPMWMNLSLSSAFGSGFWHRSFGPLPAEALGALRRDSARQNVGSADSWCEPVLGHAAFSPQARQPDLHGLNVNIHIPPPWHNQLCMNRRGRDQDKGQPELPLKVWNDAQLSQQSPWLKMELTQPLNPQKPQPLSPRLQIALTLTGPFLCWSPRRHPEDTHSHVEPILWDHQGRVFNGKK